MLEREPVHQLPTIEVNGKVAVKPILQAGRRSRRDDIRGTTGRFINHRDGFSTLRVASPFYATALRRKFDIVAFCDCGI